MKKVIQITLSGHPTPFTLDEDADNALLSYLGRARSNLEGNPDREDVLSDLEQSIAEKLTRLPLAASRIVSRGEVESALDEIGVVEPAPTGDGAPEAPVEHRRRFYRINQGRWLAGVCQGLAAYSAIRVRWVRLIVVVLSLFIMFLATIMMFSNFSLGLLTATLPAGVYIVLTFTIPAVGNCAEYLSACRGHVNLT